jgi:hypothetical protein
MRYADEAIVERLGRAGSSASSRQSPRLRRAATSRFAFTPASASSTRSGTPVYSTQCTMPWVYWQPLSCAPRHSMPEFGRAFEEVDAVHAREALQVGEREDQRLVDEAVHDQPVSPSGSISAMPP